MTYREKYSSTRRKDWQLRVKIVYNYHIHQVKKHGYGKWFIKHTANYFGLSIGLVSESLTLGRHLDKLKDCKNRADALIAVKQFD